MATTNRNMYDVDHTNINHSNRFTFAQTLKMLGIISGFHLKPQNNKEKVEKRKAGTFKHSLAYLPQHHQGLPFRFRFSLSLLATLASTAWGLKLTKETQQS